MKFLGSGHRGSRCMTTWLAYVDKNSRARSLTLYRQPAAIPRLHWRKIKHRLTGAFSGGLWMKGTSSVYLWYDDAVLWLLLLLRRKRSLVYVNRLCCCLLRSILSFSIHVRVGNSKQHLLYDEPVVSLQLHRRPMEWTSEDLFGMLGDPAQILIDHLH